MTIFCNYNIPILPMSLGTSSLFGSGYMSFYAPQTSIWSGISSFGMYNPMYSQIFNFEKNAQQNIKNSFWNFQPTNLFSNFSFNMPTFNFMNLKIDFSPNTSNIKSNNNSPSSDYIKYEGGKIKIDGYNSSVGIKLANAALKQSNGRTKGTGYCSRGVRTAMQEVGVCTTYPGHAADFIPILDKNPHFKKLDNTNIDVKDLPAGCILVYGRGVSGYSSESGHVEITTGDGRAASDFVHNVYKKPTAIYVPV